MGGMIEPHFHWEFVAWNTPDPVEDAPVKMEFAVGVIVIGYLSEADALLGVQDIVTRKHYRLYRCTECTSCSVSRHSAESLQQIAKKA